MEKMSESGSQQIRKNVWKTLKWLFFNFAFGLAPLLLMLICKPIITKAENSNEVNGEITHLMNGGLVFFVCVALMGSVVIDIINSDYKDRISTDSYFLIIVSPFVVLGFVLFVYLLVILGAADASYFSSTSWLNIGVMIYSVGYCFISKYRMFALED